jgi:hypothetical protein
MLDIVDLLSTPSMIGVVRLGDNAESLRSTLIGCWSCRTPQERLSAALVSVSLRRSQPTGGPMAELARYVSFSVIDFESNMQAVLDHLQRYLDDPETCNALWQRFKKRLADAETRDLPVNDKLLLMHSHVYYMEELFDEHEDEAALAALRKLEEECF